MGGVGWVRGLVKEVNTFCDVIRGDNIDIMEDIIVDTGDIVGGQTRSDNESYNDNTNNDNNNNDNTNNHQQQLTQLFLQTLSPSFYHQQHQQQNQTEQYCQY